MVNYILISSIDINEMIIKEIQNYSQGHGIAYLRCSSRNFQEYYYKVKKIYEKCGYSNIKYFDLDKNYDSKTFKKIEDYPIIHISGGNTFEFMNKINELNIRKYLVDIIKSRKLVVGESAGGIILGPLISTAKYFDNNKFNVSDIGLDILDFCFLPHYNQMNEEQLNDLKNQKFKEIVFCEDGEGIIMHQYSQETSGHKGDKDEK